jgi:hypothetical protein
VLAISSNGGATWSGKPVGGRIVELSAVSCVSAAQCTATGVGALGRGVVIAVTGGPAWQAIALPSGTRGLDAVAYWLPDEVLVAGSGLLSEAPGS